MKYAVIQIGYVAYGVGCTEQEAISNAREYMTGDEEEIDFRHKYFANVGDLVVVQCTDAFADAFDREGGDFLYEIQNGIADILENDHAIKKGDA